MLQDSRLCAFVATTDAERAKVFYRDVLKLKLISDDQFALVFEANGTMLRIQKVKEFTPHPFTSLGWNVGDIHAVIKDLTSRGVQMMKIQGFPQDEDGICTFPGGDRVAWFKDPDGNTLSLAQFSR